MRIGFHGELRDDRVVRVGFIGCGSHAFRNLYPALQFAPFELVAVCDLERQRADAFARRFSLGQLYNKGLFLLGYVPELTEFAGAVLAGRPPVAGTLDDAWHLTRLFAAFAEGPGHDIDLGRPVDDHDPAGRAAP